LGGAAAQRHALAAVSHQPDQRCPAGARAFSARDDSAQDTGEVSVPAMGVAT